MQLSFGSEYVSYDLGADGLAFSLPIYNRVLQEAADMSADPSFKAATYFTRHADMDISRLAVEMVEDRVQLSKSLQFSLDEEQLRAQVERLVLDFRLDYVEHQLKSLQRQISQAGNDMARMMELMSQYKDMQLMRNNMAKKLGSNIVV